MPADWRPPVTPLTRATSAEAGLSTHIIPNWESSLDVFALKLKSELVFDGDAAPDDLGCADAAPSHPCVASISIIGRYIPNSPTSVIDAGLTARHPSGWFGSLMSRIPACHAPSVRGSNSSFNGC